MSQIWPPYFAIFKKCFRYITLLCYFIFRIVDIIKPMFFIYFFDLLALMAVYDVRSVAIFVIQSKSGKSLHFSSLFFLMESTDQHFEPEQTFGHFCAFQGACLNGPYHILTFKFYLQYSSSQATVQNHVHFSVQFSPIYAA